VRLVCLSFPRPRSVYIVTIRVDTRLCAWLHHHDCGRRPRLRLGPRCVSVQSHLAAADQQCWRVCRHLAVPNIYGRKYGRKHRVILAARGDGLGAGTADGGQERWLATEAGPFCARGQESRTEEPRRLQT